MLNKVIIITGPTSSGKSKLADSIYDTIPSIIINADALQVYDALPILTAKPDGFMDSVKYRLYSDLSAQSDCSVARWLEMVEREIQDAWSRNITPVIVGGTGFYIKALLCGLSAVPSIDEDVMLLVQKEFESLGREVFFELLSRNDLKIATRVHKNDTYRILRAAAVFKQTGKSIYDYAENAVSRYQNFFQVLLEPEREALYQWCDNRFNQMLDRGVIEEVKNFMDRKQSERSYSVEKAIGYRQLELYLRSEIELSEVKEITQRLTRNYAKRQCTWFRNQATDRYSVQYKDYADIEHKLLNEISGFVSG